MKFFCLAARKCSKLSHFTVSCPSHFIISLSSHLIYGILFYLSPSLLFHLSYTKLYDLCLSSFHPFIIPHTFTLLYMYFNTSVLWLNITSICLLSAFLSWYNPALLSCPTSSPGSAHSPAPGFVSNFAPRYTALFHFNVIVTPPLLYQDALHHKINTLLSIDTARTLF